MSGIQAAIRGFRKPKLPVLYTRVLLHAILVRRRCQVAWKINRSRGLVGEECAEQRLALNDPERSKAVRKVEKIGEEGRRLCQFRKNNWSMTWARDERPQARKQWVTNEGERRSEVWLDFERSSVLVPTVEAKFNF